MVATEWNVLGGLDPEAGSRVVGLNVDHMVRMQLLVPDGQRLQRKQDLQTNRRETKWKQYKIDNEH